MTDKAHDGFFEVNSISLWPNEKSLSVRGVDGTLRHCFDYRSAKPFKLKECQK